MPFNGGDAHVWGLEGEIEAHLTEAFEIDASYSYLHYRYTRIKDPSSFVTIGMVTPFTPSTKWSIGAQYEFTLPAELGTFTPRIDASYQSSVFTLPTNSASNRIDGYTTENARFTWRSPDSLWDVSAAVTNLSDEYYYLTLNDLSATGGFIQGQPGRPREFAFSVKRKF